MYPKSIFSWPVALGGELPNEEPTNSYFNLACRLFVVKEGYQLLPLFLNILVKALTSPCSKKSWKHSVSRKLWGSWKLAKEEITWCTESQQ